MAREADSSRPGSLRSGRLGVWSHVRALSRLVLLLVWVMGFSVATLAAGRGLLGSSGRRLTRRVGLQRRGARGALRLMGARVSVEGTPPRPPFFLTSNHVSYVDILLAAACLDTVFVGKREIDRWPVLGSLARGFGIVYVDRSRPSDVLRVGREIASRMGEGVGVTVFPEGAIGRGERVQPFHAAILVPACRLGLDMSPAAIRYETPAGAPPPEEVVCWWGPTSLLSHVYRLLRLPSFGATMAFGEAVPSGEDAREAARILEQRVGRELAGLRARPSDS